MADSRSGDSGQPRIDALLDFWFEGLPTDPARLQALMKKWFMGSPEQDVELDERLGALTKAAAGGDLDAWAESARGRLALIILLDQLPRNLYRGRALAFAQDQKALDLCLNGIDEQMDESLQPLERIFFYMPLQHSELKEIQAFSTETFGKLAAMDHGDSLATLMRNTTNYALEHRQIIDRFDRFPHRNSVLERESTDEEIEFLSSGGSSFGQ